MPDRYLALPPEQGGTCFGPFSSGTICLGTDNRACRVTLGALPGLRPIHAQVTITPDGRAFLQAGDRVAQIWVHGRAGGVTTLDGSAALQLGDAFSLGSPSGPRFILADMPPLQPVKTLPPPPPPPSSGVTQHFRREEGYQARRPDAVASTQQDASRAVERVREEAKTSPLYFGVAVLGVFAIMASTCAGIGVAVYAWVSR